VAPAARIGLAALAVALFAAFAGVAPASAAPRGFYGVVAQGNFNDTDFELMQRAGVETLRFQLTWPQVQPTGGPCEPSSDSGTCDWSEYD
jgi:hypothetical protein